MRSAAFFDFDKTLIREESAKVGFLHLRERRMISLLRLAGIGAANELYKRDRLSDQRMASFMMRYYAGRRPEEFIPESAAFYEEKLKPLLAPRLLTEIEDHRRKGHRLVMVSAGVRYLLEPAVRDLGFDHLICTDLEISPDGRYTGRPRGAICLCVEKRLRLEEWSRREGVDLRSSYAYGNHQSDIPMLEAVGWPHAVQPSPKLERIAVREGWPMLTFD